MLGGPVALHRRHTSLRVVCLVGPFQELPVSTFVSAVDALTSLPTTVFTCLPTHCPGVRWRCVHPAGGPVHRQALTAPLARLQQHTHSGRHERRRNNRWAAGRHRLCAHTAPTPCTFATLAATASLVHYTGRGSGPGTTGGCSSWDHMVTAA